MLLLLTFHLWISETLKGFISIIEQVKKLNIIKVLKLLVKNYMCTFYNVCILALDIYIMNMCLVHAHVFFSIL